MTTARLRGWGLGLLGVVLIGAVWELYKAVGPDAGVVLGDDAVLPRTNDR
jgi:NitT/TauT family transport system permease protein